MYTYIQAIGIGFPGVECHGNGDGSVYADLVWDAGLPLPSQETLDSWIASNNGVAANGTKITVYAFRQRLSMQEKMAIDIASIDVPTGTVEQRHLSAFLRVMLLDLAEVSFVDLTDERLGQMLGALEQYGLIGEGRAAEIINAPVQPIELPAEVVIH